MEVAVSPLTAADRSAFVEAARASRALHHPWLELPDTDRRFDAYLERCAAPDQHAWLLRHAGCGGLVGFVRVGNVVRGAFQSAYLAYGAFSGHEGRGLMTEGVRTVVGLAFGELRLHRLEANIQPANHRSISLVRRLGFEKEGFSPRFLLIDGDWRDHERWALRAEADRWPAASSR